MEKLSKEHRLFVVLACFFVGNALVAEVIGPKMFSVEKVFGWEAMNWRIFGIENVSLNFSAGSIIWPIVFIMTDVINEYFGRRGVRMLTYVALAVIGYAFIVLLLTTKAPPADFWLAVNSDLKPDINTAYSRIFGTSMMIIIGSLTAFTVSQLLDALFFQKFKKATGDKHIWLRATGSTLISQFFDTFIILFIAFYFGASPEQRWSLNQIAAFGLVGYVYKVCTAILLTPLLYVIHGLITNYLGAPL
ncbi:MAG: queuosine precursor transporter, partial [Saprospiraceae bacterium]|nr:queuosine precursor transporter [Saprospiraceae bacterium]